MSNIYQVRVVEKVTKVVYVRASSDEEAFQLAHEGSYTLKEEVDTEVIEELTEIER